MIVRTAEPGDARGIATVHVLAWQAAYRGIVPAAHLDSLGVDERTAWWGRSLVGGESEVYVAESSEILGWVAFGPSRDPGANPATGEIYALYVLPGLWSTGTGRTLWLAAHRRFVERGFDALTLWVLSDNERGIRFYRGAGFKRSPGSDRSIEIGGRTLVEIRLRMEIGQEQDAWQGGRFGA
jgi:GNAT superfamily N-acetyltransferase